MVGTPCKNFFVNHMSHHVFTEAGDDMSRIQQLFFQTISLGLSLDTS